MLFFMMLRALLSDIIFVFNLIWMYYLTIDFIGYINLNCEPHMTKVTSKDASSSNLALKSSEAYGLI